MFTKLYGSIVMSSIWVEDDATRILWITLLATADRDGFVWGSPAGLSGVSHLPLERVKEALEKLSSPDENSGDTARNPENEGRRIEAVPAGGWKILNYEYYRDLVRAEDRKAQYRESKARARAKAKATVDVPQMSSDVSEVPLSYSSSYSTTEENTYTGPASPGPRARVASNGFKKPTLEELRAYLAEKGSTVDAVQFLAHYESNGWRVGKVPMKNWRAAVATWERRRDEM